jgi:hypothetical protein
MGGVWFSRTDTGFRGWFQAVRSTGQLRTGAIQSGFSFIVVSPDDSGSQEFFVSESQQKPGLYFADIQGSYLITSGVGDYGVSVELNIPNPQKIVDAFSCVLHVTQEDFDSLSGSIWNSVTSSFSTPGTFGGVLSGGVSIASSSLVSLADAVWDESLAEHINSGSVGEWLQRMAYNHTVYVDTNDGLPGTVFPRGTLEFPVGNLIDARIIADRYQFRSYNVRGDTTLDQPYNQWTFVGQGDGDTIDVNGKSVNGARFRYITVSGSFGGAGTYVIDNGVLDNVSNFKGFAIQSGLFETIQIGSGKSSFHQCYSKTPGFTTPILDVADGAGRTFNMRAYSGGLTIHSMSNANNLGSLEFIAGRLIADTSCTAGSLEVRGIVRIEDNSDPAFTINAEAALARSPVADAVWNDISALHNTSGTMGWLQNQIVDTLVSGTGVNISSSSIDNVVNSVWDEILPGEHDISGSAGKLLQTAGTGGVDTGLLAAAVWDRLASSHTATGTMGALQNETEIIRALMENNWELSGSQMVFYGNDGVTPFRIYNLLDTEKDPFFSEPEAPAERVLTSSLS